LWARNHATLVFDTLVDTKCWPIYIKNQHWSFLKIPNGIFFYPYPTSKLNYFSLKLQNELGIFLKPYIWELMNYSSKLIFIFVWLDMNILYQFTFTCLIFMHAHKFGTRKYLNCIWNIHCMGYSPWSMWKQHW
jgi:hypothetical protein